MAFKNKFKRMKKLLLLFAVTTLFACNANTEKKEVKQEERVIQFQTNKGNITLKLYNETPKHRDNYIKLVNEKFFDGLLFHRVIESFMIQGGDPDSKGAEPGKRLGEGGPGYQIDAEFVDGLIHKKGVLAAAREGDQANPQKRSSGSQFYIVQGKIFRPGELDSLVMKYNFRAKNMIYQKYFRAKYSELSKAGEVIDNIKIDSLIMPIVEKEFAKYPKVELTDYQKKIYTTVGGTPHLDGNYTVFGEVIEGLDIVDKIAASETGEYDRPTEDVIIKKAVIIK